MLTLRHGTFVLANDANHRRLNRRATTAVVDFILERHILTLFPLQMIKVTGRIKRHHTIGRHLQPAALRQIKRPTAVARIHLARITIHRSDGQSVAVGVTVVEQHTAQNL